MEFSMAWLGEAWHGRARRGGAFFDQVKPRDGTVAGFAILRIGRGRQNGADVLQGKGDVP